MPGDIGNLVGDEGGSTPLGLTLSFASLAVLRGIAESIQVLFYSVRVALAQSRYR